MENVFPLELRLGLEGLPEQAKVSHLGHVPIFLECTPSLILHAQLGNVVAHEGGGSQHAVLLLVCVRLRQFVKLGQLTRTEITVVPKELLVVVN